jgi:hypothetical protein
MRVSRADKQEAAWQRLQPERLGVDVMMDNGEGAGNRREHR